MPEAPRHWTPARYWHKLNNISKAIISCGDSPDISRIPDLVALCEVENDSVLHDLTRRSLLRKAGYDYIMTDSPDERGIDVALLYSPFSFSPIRHYPLRIPLVDGMRPTRDILYVSGRIITDDTLHIFVCHAPSRYGGERRSRPFRQAAADRLCASVDSIRTLSPDALIIVAGDFNDYSVEPPLASICSRSGLTDVTCDVQGSNGAKGTYRYNGRWGSLDHILVSAPMLPLLVGSYVNDALFLMTDDTKYGGMKPHRTYTGYRYSADGTSDHLPLVVRFRL